MKHYYCSAYSAAYCYQGIVLYNSIKKVDEAFTLFLVCLDNTAYEILSQLELENLEVIKVKEIEDDFPELKLVKRDRAINEYAWTIKSSEILYIFENYQEVDRIIWLDGDTQMLSDPIDIYDEWSEHSIILTEQYYTDHHESLIKTYGRFQAGFIGFMKDFVGIHCLKWWQRKCIDWCYFTAEEGRWADQKYLDNVPELYENICIVKSLGINMTPFTLYRLNFEQQKYFGIKDNKLFINNIKLVLFHYYGFRYYDENNIDLCSYWMKFTRNSIEYVYIPYIKACKAAMKEIELIKKDYNPLLNKKAKRINNYFDLSRSKADTAYDIATIVWRGTLQEAVALYHSLLQHEDSFYWWVCCIDIESYNRMKTLKLPNTTVIYIDNLMDSALSVEIKRKPDSNHIERLKIYFLLSLLKNNFSIQKLLYMNSDFYVFTGFSDVFKLAEDYNALLFKHNQMSMSNQIAVFDKDLIGLNNCKETVDLLEYCLDTLKGFFYLSDKVSKYLNSYVVEGLEYCSAFDDLKYYDILVKNGKLYMNQRLIRCFHFNDNERFRDGKVRINRKAKLYLDKDLYSYIYDRYHRALGKARIEVNGYYG
ncbi:MAG: putative Glycosyltransferase [Clostridia bacterium]|jgi:hypothetical protein|nr:putative Glycosyltransferase [Clostridia bacterium]